MILIFKYTYKPPFKFLVNIYIYVTINYIGTIIVINTDDYVKIYRFDSLIFMLGVKIIASKLF